MKIGSNKNQVMNKIEIPISKTKVILMVLGSLLFVCAGFWIVLTIADQQSRYNSVFLKIVGMIAVLFFGTTGVFSLKKIFDNKPGLIIDEKGIIDHSGGVSIGLIEWVDITGVRTVQVMSTKFLLIDTINPDKYYEKASRFKRRMMKYNMNMYGTPLSIASNTLKYNFDELVKLILIEFDKNKKSCDYLINSGITTGKS